MMLPQHCLITVIKPHRRNSKRRQIKVAYKQKIHNNILVTSKLIIREAHVRELRSKKIYIFIWLVAINVILGLVVLRTQKLVWVMFSRNDDLLFKHIFKHQSLLHFCKLLIFFFCKSPKPTSRSILVTAITSKAKCSADLLS